MILRKPYAFLIRNFRKINFILLVLSVYVFMKTTDFVTLTKNYSGYGSSLILDEILSNFNALYFSSLVLILLGTLIVIYLLYRKEKPIKTYLIVFISYFVLFIFSIISNNYFSDVLLEGFDKAMARNMNGFFFIFSLPQYIVLLLLTIRTIGLDLNSFGFRQDIELLISEEDREEVEVEVEFNKDKWIRKIKYYLRQIKYFIKQNKIYVILALVVIALIGSFITYHQVYVVNKVYKQGEILTSNNYSFQVNNTYITTKDYKGDEIKKGKSYVIIDLNTRNNLGYTRTLDIDKFMLLVDDKMYTPSIDFNECFSDLGPVFKHQNLEGGQLANYFLIFEVDTPTNKTNFKLQYQDRSKLIRIKLQIKDISAFVVRDTKNIGEVEDVVINLEETKKIQITSFEIGKSYKYTYESCYINSCPIYEATASASTNRDILYLKVNPLKSTTKEILSFMLKYGKVRYKIDGVEYQETFTSSIKRTYKGNFILVDVASNINLASEISLVFTIRNNQYIYKLK